MCRSMHLGIHLIGSRSQIDLNQMVLNITAVNLDPTLLLIILEWDGQKQLFRSFLQMNHSLSLYSDRFMVNDIILSVIKNSLRSWVVPDGIYRVWFQILAGSKALWIEFSRIWSESVQEIFRSTLTKNSL